ncbi:hypothetical protein Q4566_10045 [Tamlana sp. 2_MG-2023]|uniref:hypothetical protein n=1 Tax=unclassified Tamlana TaxID=2614803 RepID=UPI0026E2883A|nr:MULTISPECIES: hypothetical protein [unclassified Tamlana]MDO6760539.1 hypothetical protein [Tamlana sp. 2_MG-2023]MDO6790795.1 hypothetical protein [Tamlana sp. 1_MG-2023]
MKLISLFLCCLMTVKSCGTVHPSKSGDSLAESEASQVPSETMITFEYTATTRGSYQKISVIENMVVVSKKRGKPGSPVVLEASEWKKLLSILEPIPLKDLNTIKAPSQDFAFDGAAKATLKITSNEKTYETPPFDHGNPPKELETLVKELLSISENIE